MSLMAVLICIVGENIVNYITAVLSIYTVSQCVIIAIIDFMKAHTTNAFDAICNFFILHKQLNALIYLAIVAVGEVKFHLISKML